MISRYERLSRQPTPPTIFAYEVIFRAPARELFAGMYQKVELVTLERIQTLARKLDAAKPDRLTARKMQALMAAVSESMSEADRWQWENDTYDVRS